MGQTITRATETIENQCEGSNLKAMCKYIQTNLAAKGAVITLLLAGSYAYAQPAVSIVPFSMSFSGQVQENTYLRHTASWRSFYRLVKHKQEN